MALQMVLKIEGISGESKSYQYRGWSEVLSWNWGMTSNRKAAQATEADKTSLNELSIIKPIGVDSGSIRRLYAEGSVIPTVEFIVAPVVGKREAPMKYVNILMQDVVIKSIITSGNAEEAFFKEHISFLYDRISFECSHDAQGSSEPDKHSGNGFAWDIAANASWQQS